jgi:outer membrane protein
MAVLTMPTLWKSRRGAPSTSARAGLLRLLGPALAGALVASATVLAAAPAWAQAQSKFAVVDVRRAVMETEEGLRVTSTLKRLFDSRQVELDQKQQQLQKDKETLDKEAQAGKTSKDALQKKYDKLQKDAAELQALMVNYQREMQQKEQELTTPILQKVLGIVKRIASQDGYEMVLMKDAVPYFRSDLEITDKTIQAYNTSQPGGAAPSTPNPAPGKGQPPAPPKKK